MKPTLPLLLALLTALPLGADNERFYDEHGSYRGRRDESPNGTTRFYDRNGAYKGRSQQDAHGSTRFYDRNGAHKGSQR